MVEKIGKITLDYSHYPGEDFYCDGDIERELLDIAKNYSASEFPRIIEEKKSWPVLYHLSELRENIVEWLPMDKSMKVLEVGSGCGAITGCLSRKAGEVTCIDLSKQRSLINAYRHTECDNVTIHVGNFQDIEPSLPCDYDYVCLIGVFEYGQSYIGGEKPFHDFFKIIKKHVKKGGKLVIAIENKFGLKYWAGCTEDHLGDYFAGIEGYPEGGCVRTFSKKGLERIFEECGETNYHFYYPYPDYKFMTTVYSDKRLPMVGELSNNHRNFDRERMHLFDEKNVFDGLIQDDMFPFYSNSFMVIIGDDIDMAYTKYSNDRSADKAIKTEMVVENGKKIIRKYALSKHSAEHVRGIYTSFEKLSERYEGSKLEINKCSLVDGELPYVELEYVEGITLAEIMDSYLQKEDVEGFRALFKEYVERISYGEEKAVADYDMIFANIIVNQDKWTVIDYEWTVFEKTDTKEIAFRSIYCYLLENNKRSNLCDKEWAMQYLGIRPEEIAEYQKKEVKFQEGVMGKRMSMSQLIQIIGGKLFVVERWRKEITNRLANKTVQIYEDTGEGYQQETVYYIENAYTSENEIEFELNIRGDVQHLRIDPANESCVCKIKALTFNGEKIPVTDERMITINGQMAEETYVFATMDPNINIHLAELERKQRNTLFLSMEINFMSAKMCENLENGLKREIQVGTQSGLKEKIKRKLHLC